MGKKNYGKELINRAADAGANYIKFQLFPNEPKYTSTGNEFLNRDLFKEFYYHGKKVGIPVTASVFDVQSLEMLIGYDVPFVKFAHSKRDELRQINGIMGTGRRVVVSTNVMDLDKLPMGDNLTTLYCVPQYPVEFQIDFEGRFPLFDGFSDHTMGIKQTIRAVKAGAKFIEKHIKLDYADVTCPDSKFAIGMDDMSELVQKIREVSK